MDEKLETQKTANWLAITILLVLVSLFYVLYIYAFENKYSFLVESNCNPEQEVCFVRDCSTGECPPNNLENYSQFMISADDFDECPNGECGFICEAGLLSCEKIECGDEDEDQCSSF